MVASTPASIVPVPVPFDPAAGVFAAQAARPPGLLPVDMAALTPYQRSLLVIDGTVTRFMEAWWLEPVEVRRIAQGEIRLPQAEPWLELPAGTPAIRRRVLLLGERSGRLLAWADTLIAATRLRPEVRSGLERDGGGLGRILIDTGAETRREGLWFGCGQLASCPTEATARHGGAWLTRSYRIISAGEPLMQVTESFPA